MKSKTSTMILAILLLAGNVCQAQNRTISAQGHAEINQEPDMAVVTLGIFLSDPDLLTAKKEADAKMAAIVSALFKTDVKPTDIRTTQILARPKFKTGDSEQICIGYDVTRSMTIIVRQIESLNNIVNICLETGANRLESIRMQSSKEKDLKEQVVGLATANARENAGRMAAACGARLGKVLNVAKTQGTATGGTITEISAPVFGQGVLLPGMITFSSDISAIFEIAEPAQEETGTIGGSRSKR